MSETQMIKVSLGTAGVLGLLSMPQSDPPTTAYLMIGERCRRDCAFCAQARSSQARADALSRVIWPPQPLEETVARLTVAYRQGALRRCCLQVTAGPGVLDEAAQLLARIHAACDIPLSTCVGVRTLDDLERLYAAGATRVALTLDAATPALYRQIKGGGWEHTLELLEEAAARYPGRVSTHLIAGLGEREADLVALLQWLADRQITVGLFAFTPVPGTTLEAHPPPWLASYRRLQAARFLIVHHLVRVEQMAFALEGQLTSLGQDAARVRTLLAEGDAFRTSGCADCNRPYYNERPGGVMYNYPRPLRADEVERALALLPLDP